MPCEHLGRFAGGCTEWRTPSDSSIALHEVKLHERSLEATLSVSGRDNR